MTAGVSSILSSTPQASWTCTSIRKPLCAVWCTAATAPLSSSSSHGPPCKIQFETMAKTSPTISLLLYWHRPAFWLWWTYRWGIQCRIFCISVMKNLYFVYTRLAKTDILIFFHFIYKCLSNRHIWNCNRITCNMIYLLYIYIWIYFVNSTLNYIFQLCLDTYYWTAVNQFFVWGSLAAYFAITFTMYSNGMFLIFTSSFPFIGEYVRFS